MPLYPLGISRCRDVPSVPQQAAGSIDMRWSLVGDLACAYIDAPHDAIQPALHAAALDAIHRRICVVPVRYGVALRDEAEILAMLQDRRDELLGDLCRLDSTCEMGLRITGLPSPSGRGAGGEGRLLHASLPPPSPLPKGEETDSKAASSKPQSALAYIEQRRTYYRQTDANVERDSLIVQQFVERLHGCYRAWRKLPSSPSYPIRLAFLVQRDRVAAFQSRVENSCCTDQEGRCTILGPWPPYSFV